MSSSSGLSNTPIDPLAGIDPSVSQDTQREHVAAIVKGDGMSVTDANALLQAKGFAPLNANSMEYAEGQKAALLRDSDFMARYSRGDASAIAALYQADLRIAQSSGKLTDRSPDASDPQYDQVRNAVYQNVPGANAQTYATEVAGLTSALGMPGDAAKSLAEDHFAAIRETAGMSAEEASAWGERENSSLRAAIGENAEQKLADASKVLSQKSGRKLDLNAIAKTNSARVAINLYFQSQVLVKGR